MRPNLFLVPEWTAINASAHPKAALDPVMIERAIALADAVGLIGEREVVEDGRQLVYWWLLRPGHRRAPGLNNFDRAMRAQDVCWADILWHRYLSEAELDFIPVEAGFVESTRLMPDRTDMLGMPKVRLGRVRPWPHLHRRPTALAGKPDDRLYLEEVLGNNIDSGQTGSGKVDVSQIDPNRPARLFELELVKAGPGVVPRLWMMAPGTTASSSVLPTGAKFYPKEHRQEMLARSYMEEPIWAAWMKGRWPMLELWFTPGRGEGNNWWHYAPELGDTVRGLVKEYNKSGLEGLLCDTVDHIQARLLPTLQLMHIPVPVFIAWVMQLRERGREILGCCYYLGLKSEKSETDSEKPPSPAAWVAPCRPGVRREYDQLHLLWQWYMKECDRLQVQVPTELQEPAMQVWWQEQERVAREKATLLELGESLDRMQTREQLEEAEKAAAREAEEKAAREEAEVAEAAKRSAQLLKELENG